MKEAPALPNVYVENARAEDSVCRGNVAMARALANRPRLLLADEPTGNLDDATSELVVDLLERLHRDRRFTLVLVTHDRAIAERSYRRLVLRGGKLVAG